MPSHLHAVRSYVGSGECLATFMLVVLTLGRESVYPPSCWSYLRWVGRVTIATFMLVVLRLGRERA